MERKGGVLQMQRRKSLGYNNFLIDTGKATFLIDTSKATYHISIYFSLLHIVHGF